MTTPRADKDMENTLTAAGEKLAIDSLPTRASDTMVDAIALSSPSGNMSKRARKAAEKRLANALFGPAGLVPAQRPVVDLKESLLRRAKEFREMAARGMSKRAFTREAKLLEAQAETL